jgi:hypothetical protein
MVSTPTLTLIHIRKKKAVILPSFSSPHSLSPKYPHTLCSLLPAPAAARRLRGYDAAGVEIAEWRSRRRFRFGLVLGLWLRLPVRWALRARQARQAVRGSWRGRWQRGNRGGGGGCAVAVDELDWGSREGRHPRAVVLPGSGSIRGSYESTTSISTSAAAWWMLLRRAGKRPRRSGRSW